MHDIDVAFDVFEAFFRRLNGLFILVDADDAPFRRKHLGDAMGMARAA